MSIRTNYNHTLSASCIGYIVQAIINNFAPLLFLTFQREYAISLDKIATLVTVNFGVQLLVDIFSIRFASRIGYRKCVVAAHIFCALGLMGLTVFPDCLPDPYWGLLLAVILYAIGGGLIEVLISPLVEACPTERKSAVMSLLHSFYCWGSVFVILISTVYFSFIGIHAWKGMALLWTIVPVLNAIYFTQVPIRTLDEEPERMHVSGLFRVKAFWIMMILMLCAGAAELSVSQWASAFAEAGLGVSKTIGDLLGPCAFAILMGISRILYAKFSEQLRLHRMMLMSGILAVISYLMISLSSSPMIGLIGCALCGFAVGIMWPGTLSFAAKEIPGGTAMFALMALAGDLGCSSGPTLVGFISDALNDNIKLGILAAIIFPIILVISLVIYPKIQKERS
ncbi:MAG: MFS transporter [Lachnospirales bacterium]